MVFLPLQALQGGENKGVPRFPDKGIRARPPAAGGQVEPGIAAADRGRAVPDLGPPRLERSALQPSPGVGGPAGPGAFQTAVDVGPEVVATA